MAIQVSERAGEKIRAFIAQRGRGVGLRLGVKTTGCSGLAYLLEFVDQVTSDDLLFEQHGVKLIVAQKALPYLEGLELDFVRDGLNEGFKFNNPNVKGECGCGSSFRV